MPLAVASEETMLALREIRKIDKRTTGALSQRALNLAKTEDTASIGAMFETVLRAAYAPYVFIAPPPTVTMFNRFMAKVDWTYVLEHLLVRPELN